MKCWYLVEKGIYHKKFYDKVFCMSNKILNMKFIETYNLRVSPEVPGCFKPGLDEGGIYGVVEKKEQEKAAKK